MDPINKWMLQEQKGVKSAVKYIKHIVTVIGELVSKFYLTFERHTFIFLHLIFAELTFSSFLKPCYPHYCCRTMCHHILRIVVIINRLNEQVYTFTANGT